MGTCGGIEQRSTEKKQVVVEMSWTVAVVEEVIELAAAAVVTWPGNAHRDARPGDTSRYTATNRRALFTHAS